MKMNFPQQPNIQEEVEVLFEEEVEKHQAIILYNDDVNTFDFVIETLVEICEHQVTQAEQCAYLVHYSGKCSVKVGPYEKLKPICEALLDRGLSATIEL